jgi:hypothetical protein
MHNDERLVDGQHDLQLAVKELNKNSRKFALKHHIMCFRLDDGDIFSAIKASTNGKDIRHISKIFADHIVYVIRSRNQHLCSNWVDRISRFLCRLYPLVRTSLTLTSAVADVPFPKV